MVGFRRRLSKGEVGRAPSHNVPLMNDILLISMNFSVLTSPHLKDNAETGSDTATARS